MLGYLAVGTFQVGVGHHPRPAVSRPANVDHVQVVLLDQPIAVDVNEVETGRGAPVAQQAGFDVLQAERFGQQRIVVEVNLPDRQIIGGPPVRVEFAQFVFRERFHRFLLVPILHPIIECSPLQECDGRDGRTLRLLLDLVP